LIYLNIKKKSKWNISAQNFINACKRYSVYTPYLEEAKLIFNIKDRCYSQLPVINKNSFIIRDKILMNIELEAMGIPHPTTYFYPFKDLFKKKDHYNSYIRKGRYGWRGRGKRIFHTLDELLLWLQYHINHDEGFFIQKLENFKKEFRVVAFQDKLIHVKEKIPIKNSRIRVQDTVTYVWTHPSDLRKRMVCLAQRAMKALDIDFSGSDIAVNEKGEIMIIELNSSPSIPYHACERIVNYLRRKYEL